MALSNNQNQILQKAALAATPMYFKPWEENLGIVEMRKIRAETKPDTATRMSRAQLAMPYIKQFWVSARSLLMATALVKPEVKPMINFMDGLFYKAKSDVTYAKLIYNSFPVIADRYGYGKQINGKERLSFVRMKDDPLCQRLKK